MSQRQETDSLGAIGVPAEHYWGAQTQRSIGNFPFGQRMPIEAAIRLRGPLLRKTSNRLGLQLLDMSRMGFCYGLLLEGFKLL